MADPLYFLNKEDRDALQAMLTVFRQRRLNVPSRNIPDLPGRSSDTYIAIPSTSDGVPALTSGGEIGTANTDTPGFAECDIYQIVDIGDGLPTIESVEFRVLVYNLSQTAIAQDWIVVTRDRFGSWLASPSTSSNCNDVYFVIVDDRAGTAELGTGTFPLSENPIVQILERPCGCTTVPGEVGGLLEVVSMPCLSLAVGLYGWAKYMVADDDGFTGTGTASSSCHWRIYSLCCE